jgi:hypothetical protein
LNECRVADAFDEDVAGVILLALCRGGESESDEQEKQGVIKRLQG